MFGSFMNALRPVREILDFFITNFLAQISETEININSLEKEIKEKTIGEILDIKLKSDFINKKFLKFLPIEISYGKINKIFIKFPLNYFQDKIEFRVEDIFLIVNAKNMDKLHAQDYIINAVKENVKKVLAAPFMKIINNIINNVEISFKNISIHFLPFNENDSFNLKSSLNNNSNTQKLKLLIGNLTYSKLKENPKDTLFIFNKQITINNFLIKIEEDIKNNNSNPNIKEVDTFIEDQNFFEFCQEKREKELINYYTGKDCILVLNSENNIHPNYSSLEFKFEYDEITNNKEHLKISSNLDKIELILTKNQFNFLIQIFYFMIELLLKLNKNIENILSTNFQTDKDEKNSIPFFTNGNQIDILSHKISNILFNCDITNINCVILENSTSQNLQKPKMWLMYDNYYKKYYLSSDDYTKENFDTNSIINIQRHFCYLEDNLFIINLSKFNLKFNFDFIKNEKKFNLVINEINNKYVEPNSMPIKKDLIIINNIIHNEVEKYFDDKFSKMFINSIKYGNYSFSIFLINNIEMESKVEIKIEDKIENLNGGNLDDFNKKVYFRNFAKINIGNINFDVNYMILMKIYYLHLINLEDYINILEKEVEIVYSEKEKNIIENKNDLIPKQNLSQPKLYENVRKGSVRDKILMIENKLKEIEDEKNKSSTQINTKSQINFNVTDTKEKTNPTNSKLIFLTEFKILINFKLNIKMTIHNHMHQLFKDFYNFNIQNLFQSKNVPIYTGKENYQSTTNINMSRYLLKIADNISKENILIRSSNCELMYNKKFDSENFNIYLDIEKISLFYFLKNLYFPIIQYKNNSFISIFNSENLENNFNKFESTKQWIFVLNYKFFNSKNNFEESFHDDVIYYLNSHHVKSSENFILEEISRRKLIEKYNNNYTNKSQGNNFIDNQFTFQIVMNKINLLINYTYLTHLTDFIKITNFSLKYLTIFSDALNYKFYSNFPKKLKEIIHNFHYNFNLQINEINIIGFSNLNLTICESLTMNRMELQNLHYQNKDYINYEIMSDYLLLEQYLNIEENIFNIIDNPFFKIEIKNFYLTHINTNNNYILFSLDNLKILIRKNDNIYQENKIKYQIFFQNVYEEENFEYFMYKGNSNKNMKRNLITLLGKYESKKKIGKDNLSKNLYEFLDPTDLTDFIQKNLIYENKTNFLNLNILCLIDDVVISPLFNNLDESIKLLEEIKKDYYKMKILLKNENYSLFNYEVHNTIGNNFKNEILQNEKIFKISNITNISNENSSLNSEISNSQNNLKKVDLILNIQISRIILDLFSHCGKSNQNINSGNNQNIELKHKMRLITEIEGIIYEENKQDSLNMNFSKISQLGTNYFPRNLNLSVTRINSIFLKNLDFKNSQSILLDKCKNISKENSYWRLKGFVEIFNMDHMQIMLTELNKNFKSEFIINSIEFSFCKDSFRHFIKFIQKSKIDLNYLINLFYKFKSYNSDKESVITELEMIQDKMVTEQIRFPVKNEKHYSINDTSIEYKKVNSNYKNKNKISSEKERAQSAENRKEILGNFINRNLVNIKPLAESWKETKLDILDHNFDRRSNSSSQRVNTLNNENFHSENSNKLFSYVKDDVNFNTDDKEMEMMNIQNFNPSQYSSEKEIANKISEKLNLFFAVHSFKIYLFDGKDFQFIDSYNNIQSIENKNINDELSNNNLYSNENLFTGVKKNDLEFSVTINQNTRMLKIIEDYLNKSSYSNDSNIITENNRMRSDQRNYSNFILVNSSQIETKFFYYANSPLVLTYLLEIRNFVITDSLKDSKFKKLLSNFNFEDETLMFLTLKLDLLRQTKNEMEICLFLQLIPLNILVDQLTLKFLIRFFKIQMDNFKENSNSEDKTTTNLNQNDTQSRNESVTISQINLDHFNINTNSLNDDKNVDSPLDKIMGENVKNLKFYAKRFIIQEFFVNFCYNSQKISFDNLKDQVILEYLNISSINDLTLELKTFDYKGKKNLNILIQEIFDFWKNDILKGQIINAYLSSISLIRPFKNIVGGFMEIFRQPYFNYIDNRSMSEGIANGVKNFVVSFSTEALIFGEKVNIIYSNYFSFIIC